MADSIDIANDVAQERLDYLLAGRRQAPVLPSAHECEHCGAAIPEARRLAAPGCFLCIECQTADEGRARR